MKETTYDVDCRKIITKLPENSSESENKVAGHSHRKIDFEMIYQRRTIINNKRIAIREYYP